MISGIIAYALYVLCKADGMELLLTILGGLSVFVVLGTTLAVKFEDSRKSINITTVSGIFATLLIICNFIFALIRFKAPVYIVIVGLLLSIFLLTVYSIYNAE